MDALQKTCITKFQHTDDALRFTAVITTSAVDRDSDVVVPAGMNSKEYEVNPVLLYGHDPLKPIGRMLKMRRAEESIDADFVLAPRPETHQGEWLPDTVAALMKFGALNGVSISYLPMEGGARVASKSDALKYGGGVRRVYSKWRLLEVSVVSIPANQDALISAISKGIVTIAGLKALGCEPLQTTPRKAAQPAPRHTIRVVMPRLGTDEVAAVAKAAVAKLRGQFR